jgi:hypothetical protein
MARSIKRTSSSQSNENHLTKGECHHNGTPLHILRTIEG